MALDPTDEMGAGVPTDQSNMAASPDDSAPETATVPIDFCGTQTPTEGYTFTAKVVSVDADNGSMDIICVPQPTSAPRGIRSAVAAMKGTQSNG